MKKREKFIIQSPKLTWNGSSNLVWQNKKSHVVPLADVTMSIACDMQRLININ